MRIIQQHNVESKVVNKMIFIHESAMCPPGLKCTNPYAYVRLYPHLSLKTVVWKEFLTPKSRTKDLLVT